MGQTGSAVSLSGTSKRTLDSTNAAIILCTSLVSLNSPPSTFNCRSLPAALRSLLSRITSRLMLL